MFENELFQIELPAAWDTEEHTDGAGIDVTFDGMELVVTLLPVELLRRLGIDVELPLSNKGMLDIAGIFSAGAGIELRAPRQIQLRRAGAVAVSAIGPDETGELLLYEVAPGVLAFVSSVASPDRHPNRAELTRSVAASLTLLGTTDELMQALGTPPPPDFATA